eukprot:Sspe_Gene.52116::Locus_28885_Transcript_1_1_Confidence_1.000_Length_486::g.52116::m.52116/K09579/PIN4; peptidyl-prolyl cis-trans isomerase NIMA-interacting 4
MPAKKSIAPAPKKKKEIEWRARHILCKDEKKITDAWAVFQQSYLDKGDKVPADVFGGVAMKISDCPSGKKGGSLGWFGKGKMEDIFERYVNSLQDGDVCAPFQGSRGWHMIYLEGKREK